MLYHVPRPRHPYVSVLPVVLQSFLHVCLNDPFDLVLHHVGPDPGSELHQEDDGQEDGEGHGHAEVFLDGPATPEEGDEEDHAADHHKEDRGVEELAAEKVDVLAVDALDHGTGDDKDQTGQLEMENMGTNVTKILDLRFLNQS